MATFARIRDGVVAEIVSADSADALLDLFHPDLVATMIACGEEVGHGWLWNGEAFSPPEVAEPVVPPSIKRHQGLIALLLGPGITEQAVRDKLAEIEDPIQRELTRIRFEQGEWLRDSEFIAWGADEFDLTGEQVDGLFIAAAGA